MSPLVKIAIFGWIPVVLALFAMLPPRRALISAYLGACLFLPVAVFSTTGIPDFGKATATSMVALPALLIFDSPRLARFRPSIYDVPMLIFCLLPFASSISNDLGPYDGASATLRQVIFWGLPYFLGRLYLTDVESHREMAVALAVGAFIYVPLCLYEMKQSPQLHNIVYGYHPHDFVQSLRMSGYRPVVFMEHGLTVALWMACGSVAVVWLWYTRAVRTILMVPIEFAAPAIVGTTVLCKSVGALVTLVAALGALIGARILKMRLPLLLFAAIPLLYVGDRVSHTGTMETAMEVVRSYSADRASSMNVRLVNEIRLVDRALERPMLGWGGWGRYRVRDAEGNDISVTDGMWAIVLGSNGLLGLGSWLFFKIAPSVMLLRRVRPAGLRSADAAGPVILAVVALMVTIDALPNAPSNPIYTVIAGGLISLSIALRKGAVTTARPVPAPGPEGLFGRPTDVERLMRPEGRAR